MNYFFDTYAIIEIIRKNKNYKKYLMEEVITSILNMGELYYSLLKEKSKKEADIWHSRLKSNTISINIETIKKAMIFKFQEKDKNFSFIDCVGYILAQENKIIFLTGDKEFKGMLNVEYVK